MLPTHIPDRRSQARSRKQHRGFESHDVRLTRGYPLAGRLTSLLFDSHDEREPGLIRPFLLSREPGVDPRSQATMARRKGLFLVVFDEGIAGECWIPVPLPPPVRPRPTFSVTS
jgi:hypothetical protein